MRPKVLHLTNNFIGAGSERQAVLLTRMLHESGRYDVFMACLSREGKLYDEMKSLGLGGGEIPIYPLTSFYNLNAMKQLMRFVNFLKSNKIDILQTHCFYTNIFGMAAAALAGVSVRIAAKRETHFNRSSRQLQLERLVYKSAQAIVANAEAVRKYLISQGVEGEKVHTIHNGLNLDRLLPQMSRDEVLDYFKLPALSANSKPCRFVVITANLSSVVKDYPTFLRAARLVREAVPEARFVSGGYGPLIDEMKQLSIDLGIGDDVFFVGWCDKVAELYSLADLCVLSSTAEGFSNSIVEYSAAGRPVVATNVGGAGEVIIEGQTGHLVKAGDYEAMASRIIDLLCNPSNAREMGNRAKQIARKRFSTEAQLERTEKLYHSLLSTKTN